MNKDEALKIARQLHVEDRDHSQGIGADWPSIYVEGNEVVTTTDAWPSIGYYPAEVRPLSQGWIDEGILVRKPTTQHPPDPIVDVTPRQLKALIRAGVVKSVSSTQCLRCGITPRVRFWHKLFCVGYYGRV